MLVREEGRVSAAATIFASANVVVGHKWLSAPAAWVSFLLVLALAGIALVAYLFEHSPADRSRRILLAGLRAAALVGVLLVLYELVETTTREEVRDSWVVLMIDDSVSMSLKDRFARREAVDGIAAATGIAPEDVEQRSRLDLVKHALAKDDAALVRGLLAKNRVKVYSFASRPLPLTEIGKEQAEKKAPAGPGGKAAAPDFLLPIEKLEATGSETAIGDALNRVMNETRGQHVAGIVLVTDGRSNAGALSPQAVARRLGARGIPLYTVGVGNPDEPKDIALVDIQCPEVVIAGDVLPVKVSVKSQGFEADEAHVEMTAKLDDETVRSEPVELQGSGARQDVSIRVKPERPGEYTLAVEIPPRPGELIQDNNRLAKRIRVIDKKIKVLYVDALPRWEFRYLRWGLIRDRNMEAQTYQVSADPEFPQDCSPGMEPLTAIPATREELFQYHVIILGDVDPADLGDDRMKLIREFVEDYGGGLLVIAGQHFMPRAYAGTPLEPLLPIVIEPGDELTASTGPLTEAYRPKLTFDGQRHPVLQLENDPEQNLELWTGRGHYAPGLPGFYWYYRPRDRKKTAEVLAVHPDALTTRQEPVPIFAVQIAGAGACFYAGSDEVWRWRAGVGDRWTYRFWKQAVSFLSTGRLLKSKRFGITTDKSLYDLGEKIQITAEVNDRNLKPSQEETQAAFLEGPDGQVEKVEMTRPPHTQGRYEATRAASKVGAYKVWIAAGPNPAKPEPGEELAMRVFQVQVPVLEKSDPKMDEESLRKMAAITHGRYFPLQEAASLPEAVGTIREVSEVRVSERELWDRWWVILVVTGLLGTEWVFRKRWKML
jgi:hypothetical protein